MQTFVDEQELSVIPLQKQLESAKIELKMNAERIQKLKTELRRTEKELLTSKQLANETTIREMKQLDLSDELKSIFSSLKEDTAKIASKLHHKQYSSSPGYLTNNPGADTTEMEKNCH